MDALNTGTTHSESKKLVVHWTNKYFNLERLLPKPLDEIIKLAEIVKDLTEQNKIMREALEHIKNPKLYTEHGCRMTAQQALENCSSTEPTNKDNKNDR